MSAPLVSIITPCYNGEKTAHNVLDSVLSQTYDNIELIFINDGSVDNTEALVDSYRPKFDDAGIRLIYKRQENAGQAAAVNNGLKLFSGDFLFWMDSDDLLNPLSVQKKVEFLQSHPEYGCVQTDAYMVSSEAPDKPIKRISENFPRTADENQFELCLLGDSYICCHCFMVRTSAFLDVFPDREIYTGRHEQNWQLLLPIYYKYKRGFLNEPLCSYVLSPTSHSNSKLTTEKAIARADDYIAILSNTLDYIDMAEAERKGYIDKVMNIYARKKLYLSMDISDRALAKSQYDILRSLGTAKLRDRFALAGAKNAVAKKMFKLLKKIL